MALRAISFWDSSRTGHFWHALDPRIVLDSAFPRPRAWLVARPHPMPLRRRRRSGGGLCRRITMLWQVLLAVHEIGLQGVRSSRDAMPCLALPCLALSVRTSSMQARIYYHGSATKATYLKWAILLLLLLGLWFYLRPSRPRGVCVRHGARRRRVYEWASSYARLFFWRLQFYTSCACERRLGWEVRSGQLSLAGIGTNQRPLLLCCWFLGAAASSSYTLCCNLLGLHIKPHRNYPWEGVLTYFDIAEDLPSRSNLLPVWFITRMVHGLLTPPSQAMTLMTAVHQLTQGRTGLGIKQLHGS